MALATPPGKSALGVIRVSGDKSVAIISSLISLNHFTSFDALPSQKTALGIFHQNGTGIDQVMGTLFRSPSSFTGEDLVEISCHGGFAVINRIIELCIKNGARIADPGEFSQRAFLNGKIDLSQAEAVCDLIRSETELSRASAFAQLEGSVSKEIFQIKNILTEILSHIEVGIDHSDDATVGASMPVELMRKKLSRCIKRVNELISSYKFGRILRDGFRIAIVGKPNTGKSSLLNLLLKDDRAIVTPVPGTTRDTIEEKFNLYGIPAVLADTAGIRNETSDPVEKIGIERTSKSVQNADAVIVVLDGSVSLETADETVADLVKKNKGVAVINKNDLPPKIDLNKVKEIFSGFETVSISVLKNEGAEELLKKLYSLADHKKDHGVNGHEAIITSLRHKDCLVRGNENLQRAFNLCQEKTMDECLALEIREALSSLGEIAGETVTEDILSEIFSKFCIGK